MRQVDPDGRVMWRKPKPGVAVDAKGRTYPVPARAAAKAFAGWAAAPRLKPVTRLSPVGETEGGDCEDGSCNVGGHDSPPSSGSAGGSSPPISGGGSARGPAGPKGEPGEKGERGDPGPAGEVDYGRVEAMIAEAVGKTVGQSLDRMQPQIEANLEAKITANLETKVTDSLLAAIAEDPRFKPAAAADVSQQFADLVRQNPELQDLLRGPKGDTGPAGGDGAPYIPPAGTEWSHLVLVIPANASYYSRMATTIASAKEHYNGLRVIEPPADKDIGPLPLLVAYQNGAAAKTFFGLREVEAALVAIARGEYDRFIFKQES